MTKPEDLPYAIKERQLIAETAGLRVQILTLEGNEEVPWHHHTEITDTFICLEGPMIVQVKGQDGDHELKPGEIFEVPPYMGHRVASKNGGLCRFVVVQGIGEHDFIQPGD